MRLYGSAIAVVSGIYSVWMASLVRGTGTRWFMLLLGAVVIVHGLVLLTDLAGRIGSFSGPLMIGYAVLMLAAQAWMGMTPRGPMDGGGATGGMGGGGGMAGATAGGGMETATMGADPGMVAIAVLMLLSGAIMTIRSEMM